MSARTDHHRPSPIAAAAREHPACPPRPSAESGPARTDADRYRLRLAADRERLDHVRHDHARAVATATDLGTGARITFAANGSDSTCRDAAAAIGRLWAGHVQRRRHASTAPAGTHDHRGRS